MVEEGSFPRHREAGHAVSLHWSSGPPLTRAERDGAATLTPMERNVLYLIVRGKTPTEVAAELDLAPDEVARLLTVMQGRLGVSSPNRLVVHAILGLIQ